VKSSARPVWSFAAAWSRWRRIIGWNDWSVVDFVSDAAHVRPDGVGGQRGVGGVERFDLGSDSGVSVRDNPVRDLGVGAGHVQGAVPEQAVVRWVWSLSQ
jgi:hypothetical protein